MPSSAETVDNGTRTETARARIRTRLVLRSKTARSRTARIRMVRSRIVSRNSVRLTMASKTMVSMLRFRLSKAGVSVEKAKSRSASMLSSRHRLRMRARRRVDATSMLISSEVSRLRHSSPLTVRLPRKARRRAWSSLISTIVA